MAKIGIYTFTSSKDNYGQVLQYLALDTYLQNRGHDTSMLIVTPRISMASKMKSYLLKWLKKDTDTTIYEQWHKISDENERKHPRHFEDFRKDHFNICTGSLEQIYKSGFEVFVAGSDQIWSGFSEQGFFAGSPDNTVKIAIGPSTGGYKFSPKELRMIKTYLPNFAFVGARETSGVELCKSLGYKNAHHILDPTFLISSDIYDKYACELNTTRGYIFLYLLGAETSLNVGDVYKFAESNNLEVKYVASQGREDSFEKEWATIPQWISLIKGAKYVITNSFHGTALSIIYNKKFLIAPLIGQFARMNERIYNILSIFSIDNRVYENKLDVIKNEIDYHTYKTIVNKNKNLLDELLKVNNL